MSAEASIRICRDDLGWMILTCNPKVSPLEFKRRTSTLQKARRIAAAERDRYAKLFGLTITVTEEKNG